MLERIIIFPEDMSPQKPRIKLVGLNGKLKGSDEIRGKIAINWTVGIVRAASGAAVAVPGGAEA